MPVTPLRRKLLVGISILTTIETIGLFLHIFFPSLLLPTDETGEKPSALASRVKREAIDQPALGHNQSELIQLQRETNHLLHLIYQRLLDESVQGIKASSAAISTTTTTTLSPRIQKLRNSMRPPVITMQISIPSQLFAGICYRMVNEYILSVHPPLTLNPSQKNESITLNNETLDWNATNIGINSTSNPPLLSPDQKFNHRMDILCILLALASIGILVLGVFLDIQRLFLPWLVFYGVEIFCGYLVFPSFLTMTGRFQIAGVIISIRTLTLTYLWIMFVRRHLKEIIALAPRHMNLVDHVRYILRTKIEPISECD